MTEHLNSEAVTGAMIEAARNAVAWSGNVSDGEYRAIYLAMYAARHVDEPLDEMAAINQAAGFYDSPPVARPVDEDDVVKAAAALVDLMADQVDDGPTSAAWNALRMALLPHRA